MNILQISPSDNLIGGATRVAMDLKNCLGMNGIEAPIFVGKKFSNLEDVYIIPRNLFHKAISFLLANDLDFFQSDIILDSEAFKNADLVHCHNLHGWYFKLDTLRKISQSKPVVWTLHDMWAITAHCSHAFRGKERNGFFECPGLDIYPGLLWHNEKYLIKRKSEIYKKTNLNIVVPSLWLKEKIEKSVLKDKNIKLIYNGVDANVFKKYDKLRIRQELSLPPDKKIILTMAFAGKENPFKGWVFTKKVIKHFIGKKDMKFVCLGDGDNRDDIIYLPTTNDRELMAKYYSMADVLLFTSLAENFPLVVLEAMSVGLPIVSFDVGGVKEALIHKENGYLAEYENENDLIKGINYYLTLGDDAIEETSLNSQKRIRENFTLEIMTRKYIDLYRSIL